MTRLALLALVVLLAACGGNTAPAVRPDIVFLGDSITARWQPLPVARALNLGVSGQTSQQIAARMPEAIESGAHTVVLLAGTNDILLTPVATIDYVQSMAFEARDAGLRVILATIPPTVRGEGASMARVQSFNAQLSLFANTEHFKLVDYYAVLLPTYPADTVDEIHPNQTGYTLMGAALSAVL